MTIHMTTHKTKNHKSSKKDFAPHISADKAPLCNIEGCGEKGLYKAPLNKKQLDEYQWLCLEHIREYNQKWDYLSGMSRAEIEAFMKDAMLGHRPTWAREDAIKGREDKLKEAIHSFFHFERSKAQAHPTALPAKVRKALTVMEISYPYTGKELKVQYRQLVKQYHPDLNRGAKTHEEKFKAITLAYSTLQEHLKKA
ncbi:MAG: DnaJ domain-containing protein [Rickettsiales bacterium]|nr:DnaJ domain-containing protein [Rickettsiales bacterium]